MKPATSTKLAVCYGLLAASIWGGWPVVTALGMQHAVTPYEIVMLRVLIAGPLLAPIAFRGDNSFTAWRNAFILTIFAGSTYSVFAAHGFLYAPANHGGVIIPGAVMIVSTLASHFFLGERLTSLKSTGVFAISLGLFALAFGAESLNTRYENSILGDALFLIAGIMWGTYTFLLRVWPSDPLITIARITFLSFIGVGLYHLIAQPPITFFELPTGMLIGQLIYQSILSAMLAIFAYSKAVETLGAGRAGVLNSLVPVISITLAILILGEVPTYLEKIGLAIILLGIVLALRKPRTLLQAGTAQPQKSA